jgi:lipopolysaccharide export system permease protein
MIIRIHDRYLLRQYARIFFVSILAFSVVYITVNVFEEIDNFIDHRAKLSTIALFYLYSMPYILTYVIPVSLLLATIFSMGIMARRNELTAFISSGISLVRVAAPVLAASLLVSLFSTWFNDRVVTRATPLSKQIKVHDIEGKPRGDPGLKENFHYLGENGFVYLARRYSHEAMTLQDVVVQQFSGNTLVRRVDAKSAKFMDGQWVFASGFERVFESDAERVAAFDQLAIAELGEQPEDFAKKEVDEEDMNFSQLRSHIAKVRRSGGAVERQLTDLYFKFSYPLAGSIFVLLGIALSSGKRKQSIATGFGLTLLISFVYYGVLRVGQTLGYNGLLPPFLAAQAGNILFSMVGVFLVVRANR